MTILNALINSSFIAAATYDTDELELTVILRNGRSYLYFDVDFDTFDTLQHSESAGSYYNNNIRSCFDVIEVDAEVSQINNFHNFNSSWLSSASYSPTGVATVRLRSGRTYDIEMVRDSWVEFISADSSGAYFNAFLRQSVR